MRASHQVTPNGHYRQQELALQRLVPSKVTADLRGAGSALDVERLERTRHRCSGVAAIVLKVTNDGERRGLTLRRSRAAMAPTTGTAPTDVGPAISDARSHAECLGKNSGQMKDTEVP